MSTSYTIVKEDGTFKSGYDFASVKVNTLRKEIQKVGYTWRDRVPQSGGMPDAGPVIIDLEGNHLWVVTEGKEDVVGFERYGRSNTEEMVHVIAGLLPKGFDIFNEHEPILQSMIEEG